VRTLKIVVALLLATAAPTACGLFGDDAGPSRDEQLQRILDENASFSVFLRSDATEAQRKDVEAALRALPGATGVTYTDHDGAYQRMKQAFSAEPSKMPQVDPAILPESFEIRMTDIAAVRKTRDNQAAVKGLPGVQDVIFTCLTVPECRAMVSPRPTAPPT
jgi:cell division transport system permease protein